MKPLLYSEEEARAIFNKMPEQSKFGAFYEGMRLQYQKDRSMFELCKEAILGAMHYIAMKPYKADFQGRGDLREADYRAALKVVKAAKELDIR